MLGPLQGLQPNSQQQQQISQNQQQQQGPQNNIPPPPPQNGQDYTLSSVLHFLQTEWRRYERDRNEWEIERAEMRVRRRRWVGCRAFAHYFLQARIALLEGERRSFENVKLDLMRRIKMLEYALRMERLVHRLSCDLRAPTSFACPSLQLQAAHDFHVAARAHQILGSESGHFTERGLSHPQRGKQRQRVPQERRYISPVSMSLFSLKRAHFPDSPLPDTRLPNGVPPSIGPSGRPMSWAGSVWPATGSTVAGLGKPPPGRDPKSRARSRDYLKQCVP